MSEAVSPLSPGLVIAETYEIERQLGRGGMGEVWMAKHRRLAGKQVAIKVLHVDRQLPQEALARFKREAEIAARLEHPNIVQVLDFNTLPTGQPYLVMEYLKGQSLAARAQGRPVDVEFLKAVMLQVGAALMAAHKAGVVHRDLKPENIFLVPTALGDQVKVLDFGISKLSDSNTVQTTDSVLIGTPLYMSPEQALGNNSEIGPQSDLFSLGSISYELLTGAAPFLTDNIARVVFRIAYEKHTPLANARPDLPPNVVQAVEHALEKEPQKRTPDISTFVLELTGTSLVDVSNVSSGVFTSRLGVSESMISGETRNATPATPLAPTAPPTPPNSLPAPSRLSGKVYVISVVSAVLVIGAIVSRVRMSNWKERAEYRAQMVDAGWVMLSDGNFVRDAGAFDAGPMDAGAPDAGAPDAGALDAGAPDAGRHDAGAPRAESGHPVNEPPLRPEEQKRLDELLALQQAGQWETIWSGRTSVQVMMQTATPKARRQLMEVMLETACRLHHLSGLNLLLPDARVIFGAQLKRQQQRCEQHYPEAKNVDW